MATTASTRDDVGLLVGNNKAFLLKAAFWDLAEQHLVGVKAAFWWCVANMVSQE